MFRWKETVTWVEAKNLNLMRMMSIIDQRKLLSITSNLAHCYRSYPPRIFSTPTAMIKPVTKLSPDLVEWRCAILLITTLHLNFALWEVTGEIKKLHRERGMFFLYLIVLGCSYFKMSFISYCSHRLMHNAIYLS